MQPGQKPVHLEEISRMFLFSRLSYRAPEVLLTLLIFSLSSGVVGGILFYMDSTAPNVLDDMTASVPIDMEVSFTTSFYGQTNVTIEEIRESISTQDYVIGTEEVAFAQFRDYSEDDWRNVNKGYLGIDPEAFDVFDDAITLISGEVSYDNDSCLVEESLFLRENLEIGSNYTLDLVLYDQWDNPVPIERNFTVTGTFQSHIYMQSLYYGESESSYLQLITTKDTIRDVFGVLGHGTYEGMNDKIWVQFDKSIITSSDTTVIVESLRYIKSRIEQNNLPLVAILGNDFQLIDAVYEFSQWSISMRTIALMFSIPSVIMGIMLIQYNTKLRAESRRRDVGTLKTRGASGMQAFAWVLSSATVTGFLGSLGAIATGIVGALMSGTVRELLVFDFAQLEGFAILLQPASIAAVFAFSFSVGILVALPGAVQALIMSATEAHAVLGRDILSDSEKMGSASTDILAVGVTFWLIVPLLTVTFYLGGSGAMIFSVAIIAIFAIFLFFLTRLVSRPTSAIKARVLGRVKRPSLVVGTKLMSRTVMLFKKSETMGTMFIAMVFTAGLFSAVSATTGNVHMEELFMFEVGGDISVEFDPAMANITLDILENITAVDGVIQATPMYLTYGFTQYWAAYPYGGGLNINRSIAVYGVDADTWLSTAFWLDYFALEDTPAISIAALKQNLTELNQTNILASFRPVSHYIVDSSGYRYPVYAEQLDLKMAASGGWVNHTTCNIIDVLADHKNSDRQSRVYLTGEADADDFLIVDIDYLHDWLNTTRISKVIIDIAPSANYSQVLLDIQAIAPYSIDSIDSSQQYIDQVLESRATQSIYGAYTLNVLFSLVYLTIGMTIVAMVRVRGLRRQISVVRALGASPNSIIAASVIETGVGMLLAAVIGGAIGITLAAILMDIPLLYMGISTLGLWGRLPVVLQIPTLLVTSIISVAVAVSLIATYFVVRRTLNLNIAEEIQYLE